MALFPVKVCGPSNLPSVKNFDSARLDIGVPGVKGYEAYSVCIVEEKKLIKDKLSHLITSTTTILKTNKQPTFINHKYRLYNLIGQFKLESETNIHFPIKKHIPKNVVDFGPD